LIVAIIHHARYDPETHCICGKHNFSKKAHKRGCPRSLRADNRLQHSGDSNGLHQSGEEHQTYDDDAGGRVHHHAGPRSLRADGSTRRSGDRQPHAMGGSQLQRPTGGGGRAGSQHMQGALGFCLDVCVEFDDGVGSHVCEDSMRPFQYHTLWMSLHLIFPTFMS
jgi:hypothetical protein